MIPCLPERRIGISVTIVFRDFGKRRGGVEGMEYCVGVLMHDGVVTGSGEVWLFDFSFGRHGFGGALSRGSED